MKGLLHGRMPLDRQGMDEIDRPLASGESYHFFLRRAKASGLAWAVDESHRSGVGGCLEPRIGEGGSSRRMVAS